MLFAHWLYLTAALLKVIDPVKDEENIFLRAKTQTESVMLRGKLGKVANRSILHSNCISMSSHETSFHDNEFVDDADSKSV